MAEQTQVKVRALRFHTWRGEPKNPGDTYTVIGDAALTTEQYIDSLRGSKLALPVDEEGPNVVEEVGGPRVAPMTTGDAPAATTESPNTMTRARKPAVAGGRKK